MFGRLLRHFRERAGLSQEALGRKIRFSKSQVAMVERGSRPPRGGFVERADEALGAHGALIAAAGEDVTGSYLADWFEELARLERKAAARHAYESHVVPGLLQTEAYARTVLQACYPPEDDDVIEGRVADRLARQSLITRKDVPELSFVIELSALARPIGGRTAHREQIGHILDVACMRHVTLQVMSPRRETHGGLSGPFVLLETKERRRFAYLEVQSHSFLADEDEDPLVSILFGKYGTLRAQALSPEESRTEIEKLAR
nr:helix-turn-helix transcriptional regulator [Streptomyces anulatus]